MIHHLELLEECRVPGPLHKPKQSHVSHFVHDAEKVGVFMIDFGQTKKLEEGKKKGDGYLNGLNNLIEIFKLISLATDK